MEEVYKNPVQFSKGINLSELMNSETEFHIDLDFKKKKSNPLINGDEDLFPDMDEEDDSDAEDVLKEIEEKTEKMMLSSPEYHSFDKLAANMVDCVSSGDVKILIIEEGDGPLVPVDAEVTIHYAAYWEKAKIPFDSTLTMNQGAPKRIRLGAGCIIPGLEIGITTVKGPQARLNLLVQPAAAWGPRGVPPRIRPEPALFVIVLYDVKDNQAAVRFNDLPTEEQSKFETTTKTVKALRMDAKELFQKRRYSKAIKNYQQAMTVLSMARPKTKEEEIELKTYRVKMYVNLAVCYYKLNKPKYVLLMCENLDKITDIDNHCKALFYCGRGHEQLGRVEEAIKYYKKALKLEPKNRDIGKALADLDDKTKKSEKKETEMWQKLFNTEAVEKKMYKVDPDFEKDVFCMCEDLSKRDEHSKFDLPSGLTKEEVECIKELVKGFSGLVVSEDGRGNAKKFTVIKKSQP